MLKAAWLLASLQSGLVDPDPEFSVAVLGRYNEPAGDVADSIAYADSFDVSFGLLLEGDLLFRTSPRIRVGPYLQVGWDEYQGDRTQEDTFTIDPDDWTHVTALVGLKGRVDPGEPFFIDLRAGFGVVHYGSVDAVFTPTGGTVGTELEVLEASTESAFEVGLRGGMGNERIFLEAGVSARFLGEPEEGDLPFDSDELAVYSFEFGLGVRF